jgi:hypothetical protein
LGSRRGRPRNRRSGRNGGLLVRLERFDLRLELLDLLGHGGKIARHRLDLLLGLRGGGLAGWGLYRRLRGDGLLLCCRLCGRLGGRIRRRRVRQRNPARHGLYRRVAMILPDRDGDHTD